MSQPIRAVYKGGQLWLLDPVHLTEGQEIRVLILTEEDRVPAALGDPVVPLSAPAEAEDVDEEALAREVEAGFRGQSPLSATILEERPYRAMTQYFLDSSALIKRYIVEPGTTWVRSMIRRSSGNTVLTAQITQIEIVSGASQRVREGTLTTRTARAVRLLIDRHARREYVVIGLTPQVVQRAEDLLPVHPLRTYNAVQRASALESNTRLVATGLSPLVFVSADIRLLVAAATEGLMTEDSNAHS
jgi:predicted nucleic acid-binding protein/predicted DNA-binding antitoxin AbrB/MazE fold protein